MSQELDLVMRRRVGSRGSSQLIFQRLAFGLYATDLHDWKLCCCLLSAVGTNQSSTHDGTAIRWRARLTKLALLHLHAAH